MSTTDIQEFYSPVDHERVQNIQRFVKFVGVCSQEKKPSPWYGAWPISAFIMVRPEGYGKSSMVRELHDAGFKVVFCSKSNEQLQSAHESFNSRWPDLRIQRYISKTRNLVMYLRGLGVKDFKPVNKDTLSPYATAELDEVKTLELIRTLLDEIGLTSEDEHEIFTREYTEYKAPELHGSDHDVVMLTISAYQAFATSKREAWWVRLGLVKGMKTIVSRGKEIEVPVGFSKVAVIIDDPDRTDFDWFRYVSDEDAEVLKATKSEGRASYKENPEYYIKRGCGAMTALRLASKQAEINKANDCPHVIEERNGVKYERRPPSIVLGHNLKRGYGAHASVSPKMIITTTENLTASYAWNSLQNLNLHVNLNESLAESLDCHVTAIRTTITRKGNHALLIPIIEKLRLEFPSENITFLADGLSQQFNLSNSRGLDTFKNDITVIKLSIQHLTASGTLVEHFVPTFTTGRATSVLGTSRLLKEHFETSDVFGWTPSPRLVRWHRRKIHRVLICIQN